ncbi:hypothetical protein KM043_003984 [Ampulex compressa]|nr:hypothetical protein KM043_003984 [Ampulex compressa]
MIMGQVILPTYNFHYFPGHVSAPSGQPEESSNKVEPTTVEKCSFTRVHSGLSARHSTPSMYSPTPSLPRAAKTSQVFPFLTQESKERSRNIRGTSPAIQSGVSNVAMINPDRNTGAFVLPFEYTERH